jgi:hypothetical protein
MFQQTVKKVEFINGKMKMLNNLAADYEIVVLIQNHFVVAEKRIVS